MVALVTAISIGSNAFLFKHERIHAGAGHLPKVSVTKLLYSKVKEFSKVKR